MKPLVGVLALQGGFAKHIQMLFHLGAKAVEVRTPAELMMCDALIIPGGESTAIMKRMDFIGLKEPFVQFAKTKPVFGTCAGLILMAKEIIFDPMEPFHLLDVSVERNAFGRQADSFRAEIPMEYQPGKIHPVRDSDSALALPGHEREPRRRDRHPAREGPPTLLRRRGGIQRA